MAQCSLRFLASSSQSSEAKLLYGFGGWRVIVDGDFVFCAVTGTRIYLDMLRYWNVERQEAYSDAYVSLSAFQKNKASNYSKEQVRC